MSTSHRLCSALLFLFVCMQHSVAQTPAVSKSDPLTASPSQPQESTSSPSRDEAQGLISLDVVVADSSGKSIPGLGPQDFSLLDNGQPQKILSFQSFDGVSARPPVELILFIDTINMPFELAAYEREEVARFLRQNDGQLAMHVSVFGLSDAGFWTVAQPSIDGKVLAEEISKNKLAFIRRLSVPGNRTNDSLKLFPSQDPAGLLALKALGEIASAARRTSGRKLLLWVGPGADIGSAKEFKTSGNMFGEDFEKRQPEKATFDTIYWFSALLREARVALYTFSVGESAPRWLNYLEYLSGVPSVELASVKHLDRKVLAVQSGGQVLFPTNDLAGQIASCAQQESQFYRFSFDPSHADRPGEYHTLRMQVSDPSLTARTVTGYYDQPFYSDQSNLEARRVTVEQLEQMLAAARHEQDAVLAQQLSNLQLTERLSGKKLLNWKQNLQGKKTTQALLALADASAFLDPPPAEIPAKPPPDSPALHRMVALAVNYLNNTLPNLPNFYATRTTVRYEETPQYLDGSSPIKTFPLHVADSATATVLYRNGNEVADSGGTKPKKKKGVRGELITYGTFGPLLGVAIDAMVSGLRWSRWELGPGGPYGVFRYKIPVEKSHYQVGACCLPDGDGTLSFQKSTAFHGEIAIDPESGAILRLLVIADMESTTPLIRSDIVLEYGPVEIGGKTYTCPVKSVSISRARSVTLLTEWDESFRTFGPYATMLNDITFDNYHAFRVESRILSGASSIP